VSHCGAGCALGDVIAEFAVSGLGASVAGLSLGAEYVGDYLAAVALGIVFQFFAIAPMRVLPLGKGLAQAAKGDVASLTAFEVGLLAGWRSRIRPVPHPAPPASGQPGLLVPDAGRDDRRVLTARPVNTRLIRAGIKEAM
jgi:hypothetical protein